MAKINVVLVVLNNRYFDRAMGSLNFEVVNLSAIVIEGTNANFLNVEGKQVPIISFAMIRNLAKSERNSVWLISGRINGIGDLYKMKKFLISNGVAEGNIINFELLITPEWVANLRYIEKHGADFFATGINAETELDLKAIPCKGVNLAGANQDLRQGYLTAKHVFEHVKPGTIKFVLIGLEPYSFRYDNAKSFSVCSRNLQYMLALDLPPKTFHDRLLRVIVSDDVKNIFATTAEHADLNFNGIKRSFSGEFPAKAAVNWQAELKALSKEFYPETINENLQILKNYIELCLANGAKPIGVVFPFAPSIRENYNRELLNLFRAAIRQLEDSYDFKCVDMFDFDLGYDFFRDMTHLNSNGITFANALLALNLYKQGILSVENLTDLNYEAFNALSWIMPQDEYHALIEEVFAASVKMIRRKDKIKIGFVTIDSAQWSGDDLYNLFAADERFEVTLFDCLRMDRPDNKLIAEDFWRGVEQFKKRGLNVVALDNINAAVPAQDVFIFLTPYFSYVPLGFRPENVTPKTLITHTPYSFDIALRAKTYYNEVIFHIAWKIFFSSIPGFEVYRKNSNIGLPRGLFSGYPRMDLFFKKDAKFHFDWKMARPDAKKIIYAPHWSINAVTRYATFQWNYEFFYEFAKAHPKTSWIVKPHQALFYSTVKEGVFPSIEAFKAYLQKWDDLPNAQVYTGAYYQDIFATSDGMIHDSGSFIAEYQFVDKPMIFLTRESEFNELGNAILNVSYLVDGKDFDGIAALMQRVFIEGDDYRADERKAVFDKYLNYPKYNGMLASEFIYKSISLPLKEQ